MPAKKPAPAKLPNDEVQALADAGIRIWEGGFAVEIDDTLHGAWLFMPCRDERSRLEFSYIAPGDEDGDAPARTGVISALELGSDEARNILAARILALAEPA